MRKRVKRQMVSLLDSMSKAHRGMGKKGWGNLEELVEMLSACQDCAFEIGTEIERSEGGNHDVIPLLEEYCETAFLLCEALKDKGGPCGLKALMDQQLSQITCLIQEIEEKIQVVFLPYKASMWDSMESVWQAAQEDPACEARVIPIPFYGKDLDGTKGSLQYEGSEFPPYVPVTDWREYPLSEHDSDIIYIHNPYDDKNLVTSVHPDYYSSNLKQYTDLLVYIPYFINVSDVARHFCVSPGTLYADRVVVQSAQVRATYISEFRKFMRENHCAGKFGAPEKKFVSLGSPKIDKVLATDREACAIPEEWMAFIRRPDGGRRQVVLYNTSITTLLRYDAAALKKIMSVLKAFYEKREEIVLLWRPHPLSEATINSMRPQLLENYERITEQYRKAGWGIFDITADLNRAIVISDVYYGDWSSVAALFHAVGKPVLIERIESAAHRAEVEGAR